MSVPPTSAPSSGDGWLVLSTLTDPPEPPNLTPAVAQAAVARLRHIARQIEQARERWDARPVEEGARLPFEMLLRHLSGTRHVWHCRPAEGAADGRPNSQARPPDPQCLERPWPEPKWSDKELIDWAWQANVLWLSPNGTLHDPEGRCLWRGEGAVATADADAKLPLPAEARQREVSVAMQMRNRLINPVETVLPMWGATESAPVSADQAARRSLALFVTSVRAESFVNVDGPADSSVLTRRKLQARCPLAVSCLSPEESQFMDHPAPSAMLLDRFAWRYEALHTLQWALEMQPELPWPDERCDLAPVTKLMIELSHEDMVAHARLRPISQLTDAAELHRQLWWVLATSQAEQAPDGRTPGDLVGPNGLDPGVITERLLALAWLLDWLPGPMGADSSGGDGAHPRLLNRADAEPDGDFSHAAAVAWDATEAWIDGGMPLANAVN